MLPYIVAMLVYMEHNTPGLLYRDFSINMPKVLGAVCSYYY